MGSFTMSLNIVFVFTVIKVCQVAGQSFKYNESYLGRMPRIKLFSITDWKSMIEAVVITFFDKMRFSYLYYDYILKLKVPHNLGAGLQVKHKHDC